MDVFLFSVLSQPGFKHQPNLSAIQCLDQEMKGQFTGPCDWVRNAQQLRVPNPWDDGSFFG